MYKFYGYKKENRSTHIRMDRSNIKQNKSNYYGSKLPIELGYLGIEFRVIIRFILIDNLISRNESVINNIIHHLL